MGIKEQDYNSDELLAGALRQNGELLPQSEEEVDSLLNEINGDDINIPHETEILDFLSKGESSERSYDLSSIENNETFDAMSIAARGGGEISSESWSIMDKDREIGIEKMEKDNEED